jgi:large subunit ribosomal protein L25
MDVTLTAETGRPLGSGPAGRLRREGKIPGVVYGLGKDSVAVAVEWAELRRALTTDAGVNALIDLKVDGESNLTIVKDLQRDPLKRSVTHVDFLRVDPNVKLDVEVPLVLVGEPTELTREGGLVEQHLHSLLVQAKPTDIPNEIEVDISALTITESIHVSVVVLPAGVTTEVDPDELIAAGYIPRAVVAEGEEGAEGEAAEGEGAAAEGGPAAGGDAAEGGDQSSGD